MIEKHQDTLRLASMAMLCLINGGFGLYAGQLPMLLAAAAGMTYVITAAATARERAAAPIGARLA